MATMDSRSGRRSGGADTRARRRMPVFAAMLGAALLLAANSTVLAEGLLIRGAMVFDAVRAQPYLADVLVRDGKVARIERDLAAPEGVAVIEAQGLALLPGLFDVHTHWTPAMDPSSSALVSNAYLASGVTTLADFHQALADFATDAERQLRLVAGMDFAGIGFGDVTRRQRLHQRAAFVHSLTVGQTAVEFDPLGKAAQEITELFMWACARVNMSTGETERKTA